MKGLGTENDILGGWSANKKKFGSFLFVRNSAGMRTVILGREAENDKDRALVLLA
jgi:hypothetical protein